MRTFLHLVVALMAGGTLVGCANDRSVISSANDSHTKLQPAIEDDPQLTPYIQKLGDRIVVSARQYVQDHPDFHDRVYKQNPEWMFTDVKFHVVASDTLNAFTTGGTHVYLYSKLFETCKNEDEFAAVASHEFAHIVCRHVAQGTDRQYGIIGAAALAGIGGYALGGDNREQLATLAGGGALAAGQFLGMGYTRGDEAEADKYGFQFYCGAGYDPDQFGNFFQTLIDQGLDSSSAVTSDHPLLKDRVAKAKEYAAQWKQDHPNWRSQLEPPIANDAQFRRYQGTADKIAKAMPSNDQTQAASLMFNAFPSCVAPTDQPTQTKARQQVTQLVQEQQTNANSNTDSSDSSSKKKKKHRSDDDQ